MLDKSINLLEELDSISKIHALKRDDIDALMTELSKHIVEVMKIERVSAWLFNPEKDAIVSVGEYDARDQVFRRDAILEKKAYPSYFEAVNSNKVILVEDTYSHPSTKELTNDYLIPNDVISLMDIPIRIEGELIGVLCFEKTGNLKWVFSENEQTFAFSIALVFASNMEARHRRAAQYKLDQALKEKDLLIKEINHRVKNNFAILISLLRIRKNQSNSAEIISVLEEYEHRIFSIMKIHDMLFHSENYTEVDLSAYLKELFNEFRSSHPEIAAKIEDVTGYSNLTLPTKPAIHLGLIVTEIFINSFKYAFPLTSNYVFAGMLTASGNKVTLKIGDNGKGFDFNEKVKGNTLGVPLIKDLAESIDAKLSQPVNGSGYYEIVLGPFN